MSKKSSCSSNDRLCPLLLAAAAVRFWMWRSVGVLREGETEGVWKCECGEEEGRGRSRSSGGKASRSGVSSE